MTDQSRTALKLELFKLPNKWEWRWLDEVMEIQGGAQPPASTFSSIPRPGYVRFVQIRDFDGDEHLTFIEDSDKWRKCEPEDVMIARYGASLGRILRGLVGAYNVALVKAIPKNVDRNYLFYLLKSHFFQSRILATGARSAQSGFNKGDLSVIPVPVPPISEQRAIGAVLRVLDDKIRLNTKANETLHAVAYAIFKSWFVDFDPICSNANGKRYPSADVKFPDSFEDSSLGKIPKGWRIGILQDLLVLQRGFDLPSSIRSPGPYPVLAASGPSGTHSESRVKGPGVTTGRSGVLGRVFFVHEDFWPLNTSLWVKEFRGSGPIHAYYTLQNLEMRAFNAGSAVPTLNRNHVHSLPVVVPPTEIVQKFENIARPMFTMIRSQEHQITVLSSIRDGLLPKLLSGELRVKDAEKVWRLTHDGRR